MPASKSGGLSPGQRAIVKAAAEDAGRAAAKETLTVLGVDVDDPRSMQADFAHLRKSRVGSEELRKFARRSAIGVAITAGAYGLWALAKTWWTSHVSGP